MHKFPCFQQTVFIWISTRCEYEIGVKRVLIVKHGMSGEMKYLVFPHLSLDSLFSCSRSDANQTSLQTVYLTAERLNLLLGLW
ncbi:MAG TPA: hypothetical protein VH744_13225 [Terriglobales bacterium]